MTPIERLTRAAYGVQFADQLALVCVPLVAALVFAAPPEVIGVLVACQSMAHLLGSIPFGILVDRTQQRTLIILATLISFSGFAGAAVSVWTATLFWFGASVTFAGFGVVLYVLTTLSILPKTVAPADLASANARIEIPRALASFIVPLGIGLLISGTSALWVFPLAACVAAVAFGLTLGMPRFDQPVRTRKTSVLRDIWDGGAFVMSQGLLRAISLCAIFWNFAFSALLVSMVPFINDTLGADPGTFGIALSLFGMGAIAGSWVSRRFSSRFAPKIVLLFGPGSSAMAAGLLFWPVGNGAVPALYVAFVLFGFGPSMWLIAQNAVRQMVSPDDMLGRVNAVIQTAIYGVRPGAALITGAIVGATTPQVGLFLVLGGFTLSFLAAALSGLRHINGYAELRTVAANWRTEQVASMIEPAQDSA